MVKVPKVCPDPKGMVFIHFYGIWGHLDGLQQRYLVKKPKVENLGLVNFWFTGFHRPNSAKIWGFWIFPYTLTCLGSMEKCQISKSFSEIWLWKSSNFTIIFWPAGIKKK